ncbi:hypothetical protein [Paenibacillus sp. 481]|uniref:hypothetical protein n=1 Tax=Paenibacillus sp. 481 TaxID=2835869 RepID=UPI001E5643FF|nr:hypothetical protein [Paenibacillus sp. 481]UHA74203.1 hypothetical protein KIK04_03420 [Paenibacillus sp. 481]
MLKRRVLLITTFFTVISFILVAMQLHAPSFSMYAVTFAACLSASFFMALALSLLIRMVMKR